MASNARQWASGDACYDDFENDDFGDRPKTRARRRHVDDERVARRREQRQRERRRVDVSQPFKCRHCKAFIGLPVSGGRQRNHCPNCLHSLHVDGKTPGDRASDCHSLMAAVGIFFRPNGEPVLLHRCKGCGFERYNRVAADDNPLLLMRLALIEPRVTGELAGQEASASA